MVPAGTILRYDARGTAGGWAPTTQDGVRDAIATELAKYLSVVSCRINGQGSFYELLEWDFVAQVAVETRGAYSAERDVRDIVAHAIYEATGHMPSVGEPDSQGTANGGGIFDAVLDAIRDLGSAAGDAIENTTKPVTQEFNFILIAVAVVAVVLIVKVGGKNTRVGLA